MKYKIYIIQNDYCANLLGVPLRLIEASFNWGCIFDSVEEAQEMITKQGTKDIAYTILPYIYTI